MTSTWIKRSAGWLLPISSLPTGRLGLDAARALQLAAASGLRVWQILPIGPPARHGNPFEPASAFAGDARLLPADAPSQLQGWGDFAKANADWLDDWALFTALKQEHKGAPWWEWRPALRDRDKAALTAARLRLRPAIEAEYATQYAFEAAWAAFRVGAHAKGIRIFGDVPLFVSHDSADVWAHRELFEVGADGRLEATVGVPPDAFATTGQMWNLPPYRWEAMVRDGFRWWKRRFEVQSRRFDLVRLDHFRGLVAWWRVPAGATTAVRGAWTDGPGAAAIQCLKPVLQGAQLVAEDLGVITPDVVELRQRFVIPGMRVLQFAFDGDRKNIHLPWHHGTDSVCYTGTHDNDTALGWWEGLDRSDRRLVLRELGIEEAKMPFTLVTAAWDSPAPLSIVPMQDLLGLGSEARMNRPGVAEGNWSWRFKWSQVAREFAPALRRELERSQRI